MKAAKLFLVLALSVAVPVALTGCGVKTDLLKILESHSKEHDFAAIVPLSTSILWVEARSRLEKSKLPSGWEGSFARTPSISTTVLSEGAPRRLSEETPPKPSSVMMAPGTVASRSAANTAPRDTIWSRSMT